MFKKIKCNQCGNEYDEAFNECPNCHSENELLDPSFKRIQMVSWPKQIALFVMGLGGFEILGLLIEKKRGIKLK